MTEHMVDRLWDERMRSNPRTAYKALSEIPFRRDCDVAKLALIKVVAALERQGCGWMAEHVVRDSIASMIDDATIDQPSPAERQLHDLLVSMPAGQRPPWFRVDHGNTVAYLSDDDA